MNLNTLVFLFAAVGKTLRSELPIEGLKFKFSYGNNFFLMCLKRKSRKFLITPVLKKTKISNDII